MGSKDCLPVASLDRCGYDCTEPKSYATMQANSSRNHGCDMTPAMFVSWPDYMGAKGWTHG